MITSKFFTAEKVNDYITRITGLNSENAYLIEGSQRALLYDGLVGVGSLKAFVRELTELPVTLVVGHAHLDHAGAAFEYGQCYLHPADMELLYSDFASGIDIRYQYAANPYPGLPQRTTVTREDVIPPCPITIHPVYEGDTFDLGGVVLEVIHVPGHSHGSIVLLDRKSRILFTGDAINPNTLLCCIGSTTVETYRESLLHLKEFSADYDFTLGGHGDLRLAPSIVTDGITLCDMILAGKDAQTPTDAGLPGFFDGATRSAAIPAGPMEEFLKQWRYTYGGQVNICYLPDRIRKP